VYGAERVKLKNAAMLAPPAFAMLLVLVVAFMVLCVPTQMASAAPAPQTFAQLADEAAVNLTTRWYTGDGRWRMCLDPSCGAGVNVDWAADSLTGALYARWVATHDSALVPVFRALERTAPRYTGCRGRRCRGWSDVPMWDAVAALRSYDVTHDDVALGNAVAAYREVAMSDAYAHGACPEIDYQRPRAEGGGLKTLETDANRVLAAVLLAQRTRERTYLDDAVRTYDAIRAHFFDAAAGLYTVYVFDDGRRCRALPRRFFASVNGVLIEAGLELARATGDARYGREARSTAQAIHALDDARGIFADLQAENDVVAPLVLAMFVLARDGDAGAKEWILRNAAAAAHARNADGAYGRFFDGPPPAGIVTAWQSNGGLALAVAAGALAPAQTVEAQNAWAGAHAEPATITTLPSTFRFTGSGVALIGTLGERCCEAGRARLLIDGRDMADETGIWQNKSSIGRALPESVLFAWRWTSSGAHVLRFEPDVPNAKEGGPFIDVRRAVVLP
jgi:hypothetical protein